MGPVELLRNKRNALVSDDEAIVLLLLGKGDMRPRDLKAACEFSDPSFWRCLRRVEKSGFVHAVVREHPTGRGASRGKRTVLSLTDLGERTAALIMGVKLQEKLAQDGIPHVPNFTLSEIQPSLL